MAKRIITDIEFESGFVARDPKDLPKKITEVEEFILHIQPLINEDKFVGVNYNDRVEWLEANGYKLTRANLLDASLSTKQPEE